ncbi:MAG TPA: ABC transporter substrate-binding protein [Micromonosporaceae bacterium]|nr:ABC transporter substrate-binding protein [Micromonosporaceae bacterium]
MPHLNRRQALQLLAALGATGLTAACGTDSDDSDAISDEPVRIGMILPETGRNKLIGDELRKGFDLFLSLNDGRLGGHPVELLTADEGDSVESGMKALDSLLKQNVVALTGVVDSKIMLGLRDEVEKTQVPLIGSNASPAALLSVVYIWRTSYVNSDPGIALGPWVASEIPKGDIAIVAENNLLSQDAVEGFRQGFGESDRRIAKQTIWAPYVAEPRKNTYAEQVAEVLARKPAAIYCAFEGPRAVAFIKQLRAAGYRSPNRKIFGPGFLTEGAVLKELGEDALGIQTALNYSADLMNAANRRFVTAWKAHGTAPSTYAVSSHDAAQVLDKAIRLAGKSVTRQQILLSLGRLGQIDSPRGLWQFNQPRTPQQTWYLREVRYDGQVLSNVLIRELTTLG